MKIGVITFSSAHNYGAVLQAWATQTYLEKQGHQVEIINLRLPAIDNVYKIAVKKKYTENQSINTMINGVRWTKRCITDPKKYKRYRTFERFIKKVLHTTKEYQDSTELKQDLTLNYDALIAGSDQIWNSSLTKGLNGAYFLDFGGKDVKRISYAASIGRKELPESEIELVRTYLGELDYISVREINAHKAIQPLTEKEVELVADPTFLLERADFDKLKKPFPVKKPYIYVHNVHLAKMDMRLFEVAEELSRRTGLPIVTNRRDEEYSNVAARFACGDPEQFIGVISEAEYVVTNSFHATVFALIYHRSFITIPHATNPDRMQNLLGELGIANHLIVSKRGIPKDLSWLDIDYEKVEAKKGKMRESSIAFLEKALHGPKTEQKDIQMYGASVIQTSEYTQGEQEMYLVSPERRHVYQEQTLCDALIPMMEQIVKQGGKCVFPVLDTEIKPVYTITEDLTVLERLAVPELFESEMGTVQEEVKALLEKDCPVMFVGSACRILSLKKYLGREYEKLFAVEILGQGVCDSKILEGYRKHLEEEYKSKMLKLEMNNTFRKPDEVFTISSFVSGSVKVEDNVREPFHLAYRRNQIQQQPCFFCKVRGGADGAADLVLGQWGDYNEIAENEKDMSLCREKPCVVLTIVSPKGRKVWQQVSTEFSIHKPETKDMTIKDLKITQKYVDGIQMRQENKDIYDILLQLKMPKKRR